MNRLGKRAPSKGNFVDSIEHQIHDLDSAYRTLDRHMPDHLELLRGWQAQTMSLFGSEYRELIEKATDAIAVCLARIVLRNGSAAELHRPFHDEQHPFDLMQRLRRLYNCEPESLGHFDYIALAVFTAGHDLRQDLSGLDPDGVGRNERASAEELERILALCDLRPEAHPALYAILRHMIYGSTFYTRAFTYQGREYPGGVLAAALAVHLRSRPADSGGVELSPHMINLVLLASDIDTGNVADPFDLFMDRATRLCREVFRLSGIRELDTGTAAGVYSFLTGEQERYFTVLQQFHAPESKACFQPDKDANETKLMALTAAMRARYEAVLADPGHEVTGEQVIESCLELARSAR